MPATQHRTGAKVRRRQQEPADAGSCRRQDLAQPESRGAARGARPGRRDAAAAGHARVAARHRLSPTTRIGSRSSTRRFRIAKRPTSSRRSTAIKNDMQHAAAHGPAALRRRRLRQDRGRDARRVQGGRCRLPGGGARADDDPRRAAPPHVHRPHGGVSLFDRHAQPLFDRQAASAR